MSVERWRVGLMTLREQDVVFAVSDKYPFENPMFITQLLVDVFLCFRSGVARDQHSESDTGEDIMFIGYKSCPYRLTQYMVR